MPFISKLSKPQTLYFFAAGYTSKLAGTERGISSTGTVSTADRTAC